MSGGGNEFEAAKTIAELLKGMEKERQLRVLRWVAESLDIALPVALSPIASQFTPPPPPPPPPLGAQFLGAPPPPSNLTANIKSFVDLKKPKTDVQFAAVVAYFYRFEAPTDDRLQSIGADTLRDATRLASRGRLSNPNKTLNNAKRQGYLDAADRGTFKINSVGENLVAMTLPGGGDGSSLSRKKIKKPKSAGKNKR